MLFLFGPIDVPRFSRDIVRKEITLESKPIGDAINLASVDVDRCLQHFFDRFVSLIWRFGWYRDELQESTWLLFYAGKQLRYIFFGLDATNLKSSKKLKRL